MTNKIKMVPIFLIIIAALIFSSCDGTTVRFSTEDVDYLMSSYFILRGDDALSESRSAWNALSTPLAFPYSGETSVTSDPASNYPEKGQKTIATITTTDEANIYLVTNVTTYPNRDDIISSTTESYYVKDNAVIGTFNSDDSLWDKAGAVQDFNKREKFQTEYQDGTIRYEKVVETTTEDGTQYAAILIGGSLVYPSTDPTPATDATANYSSMVRYIQTDARNFSYWPDNKIIIGVRYYTEHGDNPTKPTRTSIAYEKVIKTDTALTDTELKSVLSDTAEFESLFDDATTAALAETVIRYEISDKLKKTVNTQTTVYNAAGEEVATLVGEFLEEEDGTVSKPGKPVATYK